MEIRSCLQEGQNKLLGCDIRVIKYNQPLGGIIEHRTIMNVDYRLSFEIANSDSYKTVNEILSEKDECQTLSLTIFSDPEGYQSNSQIEEFLNNLKEKIFSLEINFKRKTSSQYFLDSIANMIAKCTNLSNLEITIDYFSQNNYEVMNFQPILSSLLKLESLKIKMHYSQTKNLQYLFECLSQHPTLESINLQVDNIYDSDYKIKESESNIPIEPKMFSPFQNLKTLIISMKDAQKSFLDYLNPEGFPKLKRLSLNFNEFILYPKTQHLLKNILLNTPELNELKIRANKTYLHESGFDLICQGLQSNFNLTSLHLDAQENQIKPEHLQYLPIAINAINSLEKVYINLDSNNIKLLFLNELTKSLSKHSQLNDLRLYLHGISKYEIFSGSYDFGFDQISFVEHLHLNLRNTIFPTNGADVFFQQLSSFRSLVTLSLNLYASQIGESQAITLLSQSIECMPHLKELHLFLGSNNISKIEAKHLFSSISSLKNLQILIINLNNNLKDNESFNIANCLKDLSQFTQLTILKLSFFQCLFTEQEIVSLIHTLIERYQGLLTLQLMTSITRLNYIKILKRKMKRIVHLVK